MVLRLTRPAPRITIAAIAASLAVFLSFFSIRHAWAAHQAGLNTRAGLEAAVRLEPADFNNWYLLGRYYQYSLEEPDPSRAISNLRHAIALNSRSADIWLDLAAVYESQGDVSEARDAFVQARRAFPASAAVAWQYGNFLLRQGETPQAFAEIRRATYGETRRSAEAFSRCWRVNRNVDAVVDAVIPPDRDAYLSVIRELCVANERAAALTVWRRLVSIHPHMALRDVIFYTDQLIQAHDILEARSIWDQAARLSGVSPPDPVGSVIWDGGFESNVNGGAFSWVIPAPLNGAQAAVDSGQKHSGQQSLRLFFDGRHNVNYDGVCTNAAVQPQTTYRFSAWVRAQALSTDEGIRFRISSYPDHGASSQITSQDIRGTQPWTLIEMPWASAADVHYARVCISRMAARGMNPRIQGTAWVDDISLIPVGPSQP